MKMIGMRCVVVRSQGRIEDAASATKNCFEKLPCFGTIIPV